MATPSDLPVNTAAADPIPVIWVEPEPPRVLRQLAIWLPYFTGTKEAI